MKKIILTILLIIVVAGVSGGGVYLWSNDKINLEKQTLQSQIDNLKKQIEANKVSSNQTSLDKDNIANWKTYENKEIGISFQYPSEYGNFSDSVFDNSEMGYSGKRYGGGFPDDKFFIVGSITNDFSAGRGVLFTDFVSYSYVADKYYYLSSGDKKWLIEPTKILNIDGQKVLLVNKDSFVEEREYHGTSLSGELSNGSGAIINLSNNSIFKGIAIQDLDLSILSQEKFEKIISTIKFIK